MRPERSWISSVEGVVTAKTRSGIRSEHSKAAMPTRTLSGILLSSRNVARDEASALDGIAKGLGNTEAINHYVLGGLRNIAQISGHVLCSLKSQPKREGMDANQIAQ